MKKLFTLSITILALTSLVFAQADTSKTISSKKGWKFGGGLPAIAYDSDTGFKYGALANFFDWGDGSWYPNYLRSIYLEATYTTKGSGIFRFIYDDKKFLNSDIRFVGDIGYFTESALDFYGFNGYESNYSYSFEDKTSSDYKSRMYYRLNRKQIRGIFDFQFPLYENKLRAVAGYSFYQVNISSVNVDNLNNGKDEADKLPAISDSTSLYQSYINNGIIKTDQKDGGFINQIKTGLVWDTRDNEALPTKGIWTEAILIGSMDIPDFNYGYLQFVATHRQYFSLIKDRMSVAYRLVYSGRIAGETPFYMLPYYMNTKEIKDGFGGSKTIRGVLRSRVVGDGVAFGNIEWRWRFLNTKIGSHDFYIAMSLFADAGTVTQKYNFQKPTNFEAHNNESIHLGYGGGIRFAFDQNLIVAVDYGMALDEQDGSSGLYIGLGWLF